MLPETNFEPQVLSEVAEFRKESPKLHLPKEAVVATRSLNDYYLDYNLSSCLLHTFQITFRLTR
jgi:hypothetical protein